MTEENTTFESLELSEPLLRALQDLQFQTPSAIQQQTIPWLIQGRHLIGLAQTGTGKTAAFALPILHNLSTTQIAPQALIVAPTRELAIQVAEHFVKLSLHMKNVRVTVLCGGQDYRPQLKALRDGAQIIVGTPGRILDHIERGTLQLNQLKTLVLDEADEMLRMGFIDDVEKILAKLPDERQIALFSATMPSRIRQIANRYLNEPVSIEIKMATATVKSIEQSFLFASQPQKPDALLRILATVEHQGVIVFVRTKSSTEEVAEYLQKQSHRAMAIHGDMSQALRERVIAQLKQGAIDILVATDVAARGLDVERITHVINYDMVHDCESYVHRIGRTGRAGRSGTTILFVTPRESRMLSIIERHTRQRIEKMNIPSDELIQHVKQQRFMAKISARLGSENLSAYKQMIETYIKENDLAAADVAAALALLLNNDRPWQQKLPQVQQNTQANRAPRGRNDDSRFARPQSSTVRTNHSERRQFRDDYQQELFRVDVGRSHGVKPGNIVGAIANEAGLQSKFITGLKIHDDHSVVCLPKGMSKEVFRDLNKAWVCGRQLNLTSLGVA